MVTEYGVPVVPAGQVAVSGPFASGHGKSAKSPAGALDVTATAATAATTTSKR
jgi:hypothetical protein